MLSEHAAGDLHVDRVAREHVAGFRPADGGLANMNDEVMVLADAVPVRPNIGTIDSDPS